MYSSFDHSSNYAENYATLSISETMQSENYTCIGIEHFLNKKNPT